MFLFVLIATALPAKAATLLVAENFGGDGTSDLAGTTADTYDAGLTASGGSSAWGGDGNIENDGTTNGNNAKVIYLSLGSYIDDSKGDADAIFELTVTSNANPNTGSQSGIGFLSFSNIAMPGSGTTTHTIASVGSNFAGTTVGYGFGDIDINGVTTTSTGNPHTLTIGLDLTSTYYDGSTQFGQITLSDSVEGELATTILTSDTSFSSISFVLSLNTQRARLQFSNLTLTQAEAQTQIPEPTATAIFGACGLLLLLRRSRLA